MLDKTTIPAADPDWKLLYKMAGVSALAYIVIAVLFPFALVFFANYDFALEGRALLELISEQRLWWILVQAPVMGANVLMMVFFLALYPALRDVNRSLAATGAMFGISAQVLFIAYFPVVNGLAYMGDRFAEAATEERRAALAAGAEALVAQNNAYGPSELVLAIGVLLIALVMFKGVFPKWMGWLGLISALAAPIMAALEPWLGVVYLWWWLPLCIWYLAVGWRLWQLGR
jgi:hypothetical protein